MATMRNPTPEQVLDPQRLVASLVSAAEANTQMRSKHAGDLSRVASSELELHDAVTAISDLAAEPSLFGPARTAGLVGALGGLLDHPNVDVVSTVLGVLRDFVNMEGEGEEKGVLEAYADLVQEVVEVGVVEAVIDAVRRWNKAGEDLEGDAEVMEKGVESAMAFLECCLEVRPDLAGTLGGKCGVLGFCLEEIEEERHDERDSSGDSSFYSERKAGAAEVLALLLQEDDDVRELFGDTRGVEIVIGAVSMVRNTTGSADELELARNLCGVLCAAILDMDKNRKKFVEGGGVELMLHLMRKLRKLREASLKVLDFACSGGGGSVAIRRVFEKGGLGVIFAVLEKVALGRTKGFEKAVEVHLLFVLYYLFQYGDVDQRKRLIAKFIEDRGRKTEALLTVYLDRFEELQTEEQRHSRFRTEQESESKPAELFELQLCAVLVGEVCVGGGGGIVGALAAELTRAEGLTKVASLVRDFAADFSSTSPGSTGSEVERLHKLGNEIDKVGGSA